MEPLNEGYIQYKGKVFRVVYDARGNAVMIERVHRASEEAIWIDDEELIYMILDKILSADYETYGVLYYQRNALEGFLL